MAIGSLASYGSTKTPLGAGGAYGGIPGQTALPNPSADLSKVFPNLSAANTKVSQNILNELNGQLSPDAISNIKDNAASFGVSSGMPGSDFAGYRGLRNLGLSTLDMQRQGLQDYNSAIPTISGTQTVRPETQIALDQNNKILASAPDPAAAAKEQERLFNEYLDKLYSQGQSGGSGLGKTALQQIDPKAPRWATGSSQLYGANGLPSLAIKYF